MKRLKKLREQRGMTVKDLAAELNISTSTIYNWENSDTFPQVSDLNKISNLLHVTVDYLIENAENNLYCDQTIVERVFVSAQIKINQIVVQTVSRVISLTVPLVTLTDDEIMEQLKNKIREGIEFKDTAYDIEITNLVELTPLTMSSYAFPEVQLQMPLS